MGALVKKWVAGHLTIPPRFAKNEGGTSSHSDQRPVVLRTAQAV
jgi:hypothetical protein